MELENPPQRRLSSFRSSPLLHALLLVCAGLLIYANTFHVPFIFDDETSITQNHAIKNLHGFLFGGPEFRASAIYNPRRFLGYLSVALNYRWGGLEVTGYHLFNLAVHILNALLVYALAVLTVRTPFFTEGSRPERHEEGLPLLPLLCALLFLVHPVQTQAVTYIIQRVTSLATLFYLLSLVSYLKGRLSCGEPATPFAAASLPWYLLSLAAAVAAMFTKEISFTLPFVVALLEFSFFRNTLGKKLLFLLPVLLSALIVPLGLVGSDRRIGDLISDVSALTRETVDISRADYLLTQFRVIVTYLRLLVFPVNQNLDYDYPVFTSFLSLPVLLSFALLAALAGVACYLYFRSGKESGGRPKPELRLVAFGILWFFITLSVESSIIPIRDVIFEHRLYLPSVGAFIAVAAAAFAAARQGTLRRAPLVLAVAIPFLAMAAFSRNMVWRSEVSLWRDTAAKSPVKPRALANYGFALLKSGQVDEAFGPLQKALSIDLTYPVAYNHLGNAFLKKGRVEDAIGAFRNVIALTPKYPEAHRNLGVALSAAGRTDEAIAELTEALRLEPKSAAARYNLGLAHQKKGLWEKAAEDYRAATVLDPKYPLPYNNLGMSLLALGRGEEAVRQFRAAVALDPENPLFRNNLQVTESRLLSR